MDTEPVSSALPSLPSLPSLPNTSGDNVSGNRSFLESNSMIAKFAYLLFVLFFFVILLRLGISILGYMLSNGGCVKLINGMVKGNELMVIEQNPNQYKNIVTRSVNESGGVEFSYSMWLYIENINKSNYQCIFYKGDQPNDLARQQQEQEREQEQKERETKGEQRNDNNMNRKEDNNTLFNDFSNCCPGLFLQPNKNTIQLVMNSYNMIGETITVDNLPLNKWVNLIITVQQKTVHIYVNGSIAASHTLHGLPKQNFGNIYVGQAGGYDGYLSNLYYYDHSLSLGEIGKLVKQGANTSMKGSNELKQKNANYLSLRWFFNAA